MYHGRIGQAHSISSSSRAMDFANPSHNSFLENKTLYDDEKMNDEEKDIIDDYDLALV